MPYSSLENKVGFFLLTCHFSALITNGQIHLKIGLNTSIPMGICLANGKKKFKKSLVDSESVNECSGSI